MNRSRLLLIVLLVIVILLGASSRQFFGGITGFGYASADKYTIGDTEITSPVENLEIEWISGRVNIEYHDGSGVSVSEVAGRTTSEDEKLRWWLDGATLRIRFARPQLSVFNNLQKTLTVSLPRGVFLKTADINTTSADISAPSMLADEIKFDTISGDVNAVITAKKLSASSTSGDLDVRQYTDIKTASLSSTSGSVSFTVDSADTISVESTSGDISVTVSGTVGNLNLDSTSGSIKPDIAGAEKAKFSSTSGDITATLASFTDLNADTTSGDVSLKLPETNGFILDLDASPKKLRTTLPMAVKGEGKYVFGDGSASLRVSTTSGGIRIEKY